MQTFHNLSFLSSNSLQSLINEFSSGKAISDVVLSVNFHQSSLCPPDISLRTGLMYVFVNGGLKIEVYLPVKDELNDFVGNFLLNNEIIKL